MFPSRTALDKIMEMQKMNMVNYTQNGNNYNESGTPQEPQQYHPPQKLGELEMKKNPNKLPFVDHKKALGM